MNMASRKGGHLCGLWEVFEPLYFGLFCFARTPPPTLLK